ncbi:8-oxo-dGTP diphosphatase [Desemzia incerta]|uniref:8-oxo-dGTP diphosphatase n=1 Tax=Desemzia incerta TaxID=82801 RepID=UPI001660F5F5|nr:8-oxo-dGTP diphosphatase [Desemzia incerta]
MSRSEKAIFTNMCMVENSDGQILVQDRKSLDWPGLTFPGGHVERNESFHDAVVREVWEETGLTIKNPVLCGIKQFQTQSDERYIVLFYRTNSYTGELVSSDEGKVFWVDQKELYSLQTSLDFLEMYRIFVSPNLSEFYYESFNDDWNMKIF